MRNIFIAFWAITCLFFHSSVSAQAIEDTDQEIKRDFVFSHTAVVPAATKAVLYERLKTFVLNDLNASDTYLQWDERGHDSIKTVAFFELENSGEITNQVIDCKARIGFADGAATLRLSGFNYSVAVGNTSYARPMYHMDPIPFFAQSYASIALRETLRRLAAKMDQAAAGGNLSVKRKRSLKKQTRH